MDADRRKSKRERKSKAQKNILLYFFFISFSFLYFLKGVHPSIRIEETFILTALYIVHLTKVAGGMEVGWSAITSAVQGVGVRFTFRYGA